MIEIPVKEKTIIVIIENTKDRTKKLGKLKMIEYIRLSSEQEINDLAFGC